MSEDVDGFDGWGLEQAIEALREDLTKASKAGGDGVKFPVTSVTVELNVVATKSKNGKAGFKVPWVNVELGGEMAKSNQITNTLTIVLGPPVDAQGNQVRVGETSDQLKR